MTTIALQAAPQFGRTIFTEFVQRQRTLTVFGFALLLLAIPSALAQGMDSRMVGDASVWVKPTKFLISVGVFTLTAAWFFGYVRPERRASRLMRVNVAALMLSGGFEIVWIGWQASQGADSHFNLSTPFTTLMFSLMGLFALLFTATALPLAWEIGRRPAKNLRTDFVAAVVIGLVLTFILGAGAGAYMGANGSHAVGPEGANLPIMGWNRLGGDLRVPHFFGIHAEHALPLLAWASAGLVARLRWATVIAGATLYTGLTLALFVQAIAGKPFIPIG